MTAATARPQWASAKRIVVKIGSALLVDRATGRLRATWLNSMADDVAALMAEGRDVVPYHPVPSP
jgi:glutamate 5-kinase